MNNYKLLTFILILLYSLNTKQGLSQTVEPGEENEIYPEIEIPPSPSMWNFQNHLENPISYYNGQYPFTIPIFQIETDFINLPIKLSYQTNGVRVDDIASDCGMGWNLSAGGSISRVVKGRPDESASGAWNLLSNFEIAPTYDCLELLIDDLNNAEYAHHSGQEAWVWQIIDGDYHYEYDLYSYNFAGYSGKFFITHD